MFNRLLRELKKRGYSRQTLADYLGITYVTLYNKLNGNTEFTRSEMLNTKELLKSDLTLEELFKED